MSGQEFDLLSSLQQQNAHPCAVTRFLLTKANLSAVPDYLDFTNPAILLDPAMWGIYFLEHDVKKEDIITGRRHTTGQDLAFFERECRTQLHSHFDHTSLELHVASLRHEFVRLWQAIMWFDGHSDGMRQKGCEFHYYLHASIAAAERITEPIALSLCPTETLRDRLRLYSTLHQQPFTYRQRAAGLSMKAWTQSVQKAKSVDPAVTVSTTQAAPIQSPATIQATPPAVSFTPVPKDPAPKVVQKKSPKKKKNTKEKAKKTNNRAVTGKRKR